MLMKAAVCQVQPLVQTKGNMCSLDEIYKLQHKWTDQSPNLIQIMHHTYNTDYCLFCVSIKLFLLEPHS
jgi:hypothetical protein